MDHYYSMKRTELKELAEARGLKRAYTFRKIDLISWLQEQDEHNTETKTSQQKSTVVKKRTRKSADATATKEKPTREKRTKEKPTKEKPTKEKPTREKRTKEELTKEKPTKEESPQKKSTREKRTLEKSTKKTTSETSLFSGVEEEETTKTASSKKRTAQERLTKKISARTSDGEEIMPKTAFIVEAPFETASAETMETEKPTETEEPTIETMSPESTCTEEATDTTQYMAEGNGKKPRRELPADTGVLEVMSDGYGFLRGEKEDGTRADYYVPAVQIKRFNLKSGDIIEGIVGDAHDKDKYAPIIYINAVNGTSPTSYVRRMEFDDLTPIYPNERLRLETVPEGISNRIVDLVAPVGRGQRGLIVSPPKAGKTTLLKSIAQAIELTYPEVYLFILLIDERPEEVTDFEQSVNRMRKADDAIRTEVVASTFDKQAQNHTRTAEELLDRAKRLVESGQDVMILLDSLTRLSRAYNITTTPSGRTLSGGLDPVALYPPKKFFGAARNIRDAGSLTILATCLKDTGSRMDDMIYEEFKGTGNMEVHLSRNLSEMRIFPAIDIFSSGTRREDLLLTKEEQNAMVEVRKQGRNADETAVMEQFVRLMKNTETNEEFCRVILGNSAAASATRRRITPATRRPAREGFSRDGSREGNPRDTASREANTFSRSITSSERGEE